MPKIPGARVAAPVLHAVLFLVASVLMVFSDHPILDGPARIPFAVLFFGDLPISAIAFGVMFSSEGQGPYAWVVWGIIGTAWWHFLGRSIEAWQRRF
jgi:hypothetical protein